VRAGRGDAVLGFAGLPEDQVAGGQGAFGGGDIACVVVQGEGGLLVAEQVVQVILPGGAIGRGGKGAASKLAGAGAIVETQVGQRPAEDLAPGRAGGLDGDGAVAVGLEIDAGIAPRRILAHLAGRGIEVIELLSLLLVLALEKGLRDAEFIEEIGVAVVGLPARAIAAGAGRVKEAHDLAVFIGIAAHAGDHLAGGIVEV